MFNLALFRSFLILCASIAAQGCTLDIGGIYLPQKTIQKDEPRRNFQEEPNHHGTSKPRSSPLVYPSLDRHAGRAQPNADDARLADIAIENPCIKNRRYGIGLGALAEAQTKSGTRTEPARGFDCRL